MSMTCILKQVREKLVSTEINKCLWSPKVDLIAVTNIIGQVILYRLSWQQVWSLQPHVENARVTSLSWRPDSKVLAIGYNTGKILLINVEDHSVIFELNFDDEVSTLTWCNCLADENSQAREQNKKDPWASYIYPLPELAKSFNETLSHSKANAWQEPELLQNQSELSILCIGIANCFIYLYGFGLFHIGTIDIKACCPNLINTKIINVMPSSKFEFLSLILEKNESCKDIIQVSVKTPTISARYKELNALAQKYGQIHSLMTYITYTVNLIDEAYDRSLLELDAKLAEYAANLEENEVSAQFMELLVFGQTNRTLGIFIADKFSESNLKKIRTRFDICYNSMQELITKHLQQAGVTLMFLLIQVQGLAKREELYESLGVHEKDVVEAMAAVGSFLLKVSEMLHAIESSMRDFHIFVKWISSVHLRLKDEVVPSELAKTSQLEMMSLLDFLNGSLEETVLTYDGEKKTHFRLERTGQYLKNQNLKTLSKASSTPFASLLKSNPSLAAHPLIFKHNPKTSLIQEHDTFVEALIKMGKQPTLAISSTLSLQTPFYLFRTEKESMSAVSQVALQDGAILSSIIPSVNESTSLFLSEWPGFSSQNTEVKSAQINIKSENFNSQEKRLMIDVQFYSQEVLSLLSGLQSNPRNPTFSQISVSVVRNSLLPTEISIENGIHKMQSNIRNLLDIPETMASRRLETGVATSIAVSGTRKVAAVIGEKGRRVRIYEIADEEDEEDETREESAIDISGHVDESESIEQKNMNMLEFFPFTNFGKK